MLEVRMGCDFGELEANINRCVDEKLLDQKRIVLYEASNPSALMIETLEKKGITDLIVVDEDDDRIGSVFFGHKVKSFKMLEYFWDDYVILIASHNIEKVREKLIKMGYIEKQHFYDMIGYTELRKRIEGKVPADRVLSIDDAKREELEMLRYIREICKKNNLQYFMSDGTLLGSVRHKGFIPWDDDVDLFVPFSDYDRLLDCVRRDGKYFVMDSREEPLFRWGYSQILNVHIRRQSFGYPIMNPTALGIDIFPLYSLPDDELKARTLIQSSRELIKIIKNSCTLYHLDDAYLNAKKELQRMWENEGMHKTRRVSKYYGGIVHENVAKYCYDASAFAEAIDMEFCGEKFSAPIGYDHYLSVYYGDYMVLPPAEKRQPAHNCYYYYEEI